MKDGAKTDQLERAPDFCLYARVWPRTKATVIDGFILLGAFVLAALVGTNINGSGATALLLWGAFWVLYDPLMVSRTGGTVGHYLQNLRVVSDRTGHHPPFFSAFLRNVVKGVLGFVSLLAMAASTRQKAIHDWVAGTTVQARDVHLARSKNFDKVQRPSGAAAD